MKILLSNNTQIMVNSHGGYGKQLHFLIKMFIDFGHEIYYYNFKVNISNGEPFTKCYTYDELKKVYENNNYKVIKSNILDKIHYFSDQQDVNNEICLEKINTIIDMYSIDTFFFLGDVFIFYKNNNTKINANSYCWFPCHYYPFSDEDIKGLNFFNNIICLSPSIKLILSEKYPMKKIHYLPHVSEEIDIPLTRSEIRKKWNVKEDLFFITLIGQTADTIYSNRKALDIQLIAFNEFNKKYPNSFLFFHAKNFYKTDEKIIEDIISLLNLNTNNFYWNKDVLFSEKDLAELYKLSDVVLNCSKSEGFGVPIIEAQLYKTNILTTNFLSMAEHNFQDNIIDISTEARHFPLNGNWIIPSSSSLINKLEEIYNNRSNKNLTHAKRIIKKLTSYDNIKRNLYKIL
jgi:hypothetical protein